MFRQLVDSIEHIIDSFSEILNCSEADVDIPLGKFAAAGYFAKKYLSNTHFYSKEV